MSATFNWAYKPGISNKYNLVVPAGAEDARPNGWCYVALYGNDLTGNGSRLKPYKTITKALSLNTSLNIVLGSGVYRETATANTTQTMALIGDGDVIIDISYIGLLINGQKNGGGLYNLEIRGSGGNVGLINSFWASTPEFVDVRFNGAFIQNQAGFTSNDPNFTNCTFMNFSGQLYFGATGAIRRMTNCTFVNCNNIFIGQSSNIVLNACIFVKCNICVQFKEIFQNTIYCLFYQTNFKLTQGASGNGGVLYPSVPAGYTYYNSIATLRADFNTLFSLQSFSGCTIADPKFNNMAIGDFTLAFDSPAKNLSYFGTFVGAYSIAYALKARANEVDGAFDLSSAINLTVADDSITLTSTLSDGQIDTKVIPNLLQRELSRIPSYGFNADRNGQYIDSIADLSATTYSAGDALPVGMPFVVEVGAITYNAAVYQPGDRGTTVSGATTFTTSAGGVIREILEAPQRHTIEARFGDGGGVVTAGTALIPGYWYYVQSGSITYNSGVVATGSCFKAIDTNSFSGSGVVNLALSTESYQHYEPGIRPTSNNAADSRTGAIIRGNGDPAYDRGGLGIKEFPINAKFMQIRYKIRVSNLKP